MHDTKEACKIAWAIRKKYFGVDRFWMNGLPTKKYFMEVYGANEHQARLFENDVALADYFECAVSYTENHNDQRTDGQVLGRS